MLPGVISGYNEKREGVVLSLKNYILFLRFTLLFGVVSSFAKFDKTSTGTQENISEVGGIAKDEEAKLNKDVQKQIQQFKQGRESSGVGGRGRYSGNIEMHDDYTGLTYHPDATSGLEKPMDDVATKGQNSSEQQRQEAIKKNTENAGRCKDGFIQGSNGVACQNLSPVLVDMGPAHPGTEQNPELMEKHRIYDMTAEAKDAATKAGKDYGQQVIYDATSKENGTETEQALAEIGASSTFSENSKGQVTRTVRTKDGKSSTAVMGAEVDLLRSEYGWLEQQKKDYTERAWKTIRAARLAGIETKDQGIDPTTKSDMTEFIGLVSNDPGNDQAIAQRIQEFQEAKLNSFCLDANGNFSIEKFTNGTSSCVQPTTTTALTPTTGDQPLNAQEQALFTQLQTKNNQRIISDSDLKNIARATASSGTMSLSNAKRFVDASGASQLYAEARNNRGNLSPEKKKEIEQDIGKIQKCLQRDVWCSGNDVRDPKTGNVIAKKFEDAPAQSADFSNDVREFMYTRYSQALEGPLANMGQAMTFQDFSKETDGATGSRGYQDYMQQWKKAMDAAKTTIDVNRKYKQTAAGYGVGGIKKINYQNNFNRKTFNPSTMTNAQLFGRDETRDATTIAGTGRGNTGYNGSIYGTTRRKKNLDTGLANSTSTKKSTPQTTTPSITPSNGIRSLAQPGDSLAGDLSPL